MTGECEYADAEYVPFELRMVVLECDNFRVFQMWLGC